jgi:hypothetical protein
MNADYLRRRSRRDGEACLLLKTFPTLSASFAVSYLRPSAVENW